MANHSTIHALKSPWTIWEGKKIWHWKINPQGKCPKCYQERAEKSSKKITRLGQSGNNTQVLMCLWKWWKSNAVNKILHQIRSDQSLSHVRLFATPRIEARQASLSITSSRSPLRHVHRVSDAIQPSHPLSSPSPPAPNLSQHQSLFQWVNSSHEVAKELEFQL